MNEPALMFDAVSRSFGPKIALDRFSMTVEAGTVVGLLGGNGAGKTTTLLLAHGLLRPDRGRVRVLGLDPVDAGDEVRPRVSLLREEASLYPWMTVREILDFSAGLHPRWDADLASSFTRKLEIDPSAKVGTVSRGTRAKLALVLAVACRPRVLLLDDPTSGLDPLVRREVLETVLETVPAEGGAVLYASHLIHDLERVADRVVVLDEGRQLLEGSVDELKGRVLRMVAVFEGEAPRGVSLPGQIDPRREGSVLRVVADSENGELSSELRRRGARRVEVESMSLAEILLACLQGGGNREASGA